MKIRIIKLEELPDALWPNNIQVGWENTFETIDENFRLHEPTVGQRFWPSRYWSTSNVVEIIDEKTFKTLSSVYQWEKLE